MLFHQSNGGRCIDLLLIDSPGEGVSGSWAQTWYQRGLNVCQLAGVLPSVLATDQLGRRGGKLLLPGLILMTICFVVIAALVGLVGLNCKRLDIRKSCWLGECCFHAIVHAYLESNMGPRLRDTSIRYLQRVPACCRYCYMASFITATNSLWCWSPRSPLLITNWLCTSPCALLSLCLKYGHSTSSPRRRAADHVFKDRVDSEVEVLE